MMLANEKKNISAVQNRRDHISRTGKSDLYITRNQRGRRKITF